MSYTHEGLFSLNSRVVLVTGAGGQLGQEIVDSLLAMGASCVASDSDTQTLDRAVSKRNWSAKPVVPTVCDIRSPSQIAAALDEGARRFGQVNSLVNNAGVSVFEPYLERPEQSIDWVMDVNLKGTILCTQEFIRHRITHGGGGAIVNVASHYGLVSPDPRIYTDCARKNSEIYGATKAGIIQMTRYYAVHAVEHNIRTNAVSPGGVLNPDNPQGPDFQKNYGFRSPMGRMAHAGEIVGAICFLLSPSASYINGHNVVIDGGMTCW